MTIFDNITESYKKAKGAISNFMSKKPIILPKTDNNKPNVKESGITDTAEPLSFANRFSFNDYIKVESWKLLEKMEGYFKNFYEDGKRDGGLGIDPDKIESVITQKAKLMQQEMQANIEAEILSENIRLDEHKILLDAHKKEYEHYQHLFEAEFRQPRIFSLLLAVIYLAIATFLTFADVPLALKLIQIGFNLDLADSESGLAIKDLFSNPIGVFQANWEVFILSFGIALCTVYIKILYDEYIGNIPLPEQFDNKTEKQDGQKKLTIKVFVQIIVLAILLATIIILGLFRYTMDPNKIGGWVTQATFILLTLIFPVIGGICYSLGMNAILNWSRYRLFKKKEMGVRQNYEKSVIEYGEVDSKIKRYESLLKWCKGESENDKKDDRQGFGELVKSYFLSGYDYGYEEGKLHPDAHNNGKDLYERVEKLRNKTVSRRIFTHIHGLPTRPHSND